MKANEIMNAISQKASQVGFALKKSSPEIMVGAGIIGLVASGVMACKATTKAGAIAEKHDHDMSQIHEAAGLPDEEYSPEDERKDTVIVYTQTVVKYIKLYAPSVILAAASIACILCSHNIMKKRNVALAAAYAAIDEGYKKYRGNVIERFGEEVDKELKYGIKAEEVKETVVGEDGKKKTVKKTEKYIKDGHQYSDFARVFDDGCRGWTKDPELNLLFLKQQQNWANERLKSRGYLFLNEVYDLFNFPRTQAGQAVGWIYDPSNEKLQNCVDFGLYNVNVERARAFVNGYERSFVMDFNVDGDIYQMMPRI